ncbi:hypothetical protein PAPYR_2447 [Paratrimastix pyriformis]|uniref:RING-type domain-containing protein n=1 Tax=Paratrimastix pyriformis TaxID=342808 RepID=A0ABQ8UTF7_9EUKA|nr:hypothetical protein PAPYR_2447 [Paratrimastix pyriformis]
MADGVPCCHICEEAFDLAEHDPVVLICGHTFCRNCMCQLALKNPENPVLGCPECRTPTPIPRPFDPACFRRNFGLADMLPGAHGKEEIERLQRARDEAAALTLDAVEHQVGALGIAMHRLVDDYCRELNEAARAKAPEVEESIRTAEARIQELREALAPPPAKVPRPDETIGQLHALLDAPVEVKGLDVDLKPPTADLLNDLNRVDVKRLLPKKKEEEEPPLVFDNPELTVALRVLSAIPPAQPLTRTKILAWCRRLVTDGAPADGSCPADQLADLLGHPAFADDHNGMSLILRAIKAAFIPTREHARLLKRCPSGLFEDLVRAIGVVCLTWEPAVLPSWPTMRRMMEIQAARASPDLIFYLMGILLIQLAKQQWESRDYRECAQSLARIIPSPGFLANYPAQEFFIRILQPLAAAWQKCLPARPSATGLHHDPDISAAFRVFAFLIVQLLRDDGAMAIPRLSEALLGTALNLGRADPVFKDTLRNAGLTGMYDRLRNHPTITANADQGKTLAQLIELFASKP